MDDAKLTKLRDELVKARKKRDDWEAKVKDLERKYSEAEKVCVYGIFQTANMTPEQLAELLSSAKGSLPQKQEKYGFPRNNNEEIFKKEDPEE